MNALNRLGLRGRLTALLLIAFFILAAVVAGQSLRDREARLRAASENLLSKLKAITLREQALAARADAILNGLMVSPEADPAAPNACSQVLARWLQKEPSFANLARVQPDGSVVCSAVPTAKPVNVGDRQWFQQAVHNSDMIISDVIVGRILGKPVITLAKALGGESKPPEAVFFLTLGLNWLQEELGKARLPEGARLTVADGRGNIVARFPDTQDWTGRNAADHPLFQRIQEGGQGILEDNGLTGERQLIAYAPLLTSASGLSYHLWLAIPKESVVAADDQDLLFSLAVALLVLAGTLGAVFWGGHHWLVQPLEAMSRAAASFAAGNLEARTGLPHGDDDIGRLARRIDEAAANIQTKEAMLVENQRQLAQAVESLQESEERFRRVFEAAPHGMSVSGVDGRLWKVNPALCGLLGYRPEELLARHFQDMVHPDDRQADRFRNARLDMDAGGVLQEERRLLHKSGRVIWVQASTTVVRSADDRPAYLVCQIQDITEQKQAALAAEQARLALVEAKEMAERANRAKSQFLANMSHELRTPLNSLLILARLLADNREGSLSPQQVEFATTIQEAGNDLLALINNILDLARIESGRASIQRQPLAFAQVTDAIGRLFRAQADNKGLALELSIAPDLPEGLETDGYYLLPILRNFVANAIKFTDCGEVRLAVSRARDGWDPKHPILSRADVVIAFAVSDTGIGIAAENLKRIFDAFEQAGGGASHRYGGSGLGLHIARQNARLLGGDIGVSSSPGQGSVFTLYLPLAFSGSLPATAPTDQAPPKKTAAAALAGRTVLVVDDDVRNCLAQTEFLGTHGLTVLVAHNGQEAVDLLAARSDIDAVLMDIMMPVMDGYEATLILRERGLTELPIIALTADARPNTRNRCLAAGCSDYLSKPVDQDLLLQRLEHWLQPAPAAAG